MVPICFSPSAWADGAAASARMKVRNARRARMVVLLPSIHRRRDAVDDRLRRGVDLLHHGVDLGAGQGAGDLEPMRLGLGEESLVLGHLGEGVAQNLGAFR